MMKKKRLGALAIALICASATSLSACGGLFEDSSKKVGDGVLFTEIDESLLAEGDHRRGAVCVTCYSRPQYGKVSVVTEEGVKSDFTLLDKEYKPKGSYYMVSVEDTEQAALWIMPSKPLYYYEEKKAEGYTAVLFDYYVKDDITGDHAKQIDVIGFNGKDQTKDGTAKTNEWLTAEISLDAIIEYYDYYSTGKHFDGHYYYSTVIAVMEWSRAPIEYYVGNFRSV